MRIASLAFAAAMLAPFAASAAPKPFPGLPAGWDHSVQATPAPGVPRDQEMWKHSDATVTLLSDGGLSYDDSVAIVKKNFSDNNLKPGMNKDRMCDGRRAFEFELTLGPTIVHQVIVDDAPGVTKLIYSRPQGTPISPDFASAVTAYCGS